RNPRAVGPRDDRFGTDHRALLPKCHRHGAAIVWQRRAIGLEDLPRSAPVLVAEFRRDAPEPFGSLVVIEQLAFGIGRVDRSRKGFHDTAGDAAALAHPAFHLHQLADVLETVGAADQRALFVEQRIDIGEDREPAAIRLLDDQFPATTGLSAVQPLRHWPLGARDRLAPAVPYFGAINIRDGEGKPIYRT